MNGSKVRSLSEHERQALTGLRGLLSLHIVIHHTIKKSKLQWNLCASGEMPLFLILSGFFLAYTCGKVKYSFTPCCSELWTVPEDADPPRMNAKLFYRKRIARTLPLYYVCNAMCYPLIGSGYGRLQPKDLAIGTSFMVSLTSTWLVFKQFFFDLPSWFVSTLWFYYWCFPSLFPQLQAYSVQDMLNGVSCHFLIQFFVGWIIFLGLYLSPLGMDYLNAFYGATFWPPSRFPVFVIGVLGGLLRLGSPQAYKPKLSIVCFFSSKNGWTGSARDWAKVLDWESLIVTLLFLLVITGEIIDVLYGGPGLRSEFWFQMLLPLSQLTIVYGLSMDEGLSRTSKILRSRILLYFGKISYSLYLVHEPIILYICWFIYGTQSEPVCDKEDITCEESWEIYNYQRLQPVWCIPIHLVISIILAVCLHYLVEKPARNCLRPKIPNKRPYQPEAVAKNVNRIPQSTRGGETIPVSDKKIHQYQVLV